MYIDANDVKQYMDLDIHQQVADFINKSVAESNKMYLEDLERRLRELLEQEVIGDTASDVGAGIDMALKEVQELLEQFEDESKELSDQNDARWIPCITERYPKCEGYVLLSFDNFNVPLVGRYEESGAFYIDDDEESCVSQDMIVNAWMPLPKPYRSE